MRVDILLTSLILLIRRLAYIILMLLIMLMLPIIHLFFRTPASIKRSKSVSKFVVESDDEDTALVSPVKLGKNGEQLAPCCCPSFSANKVTQKRYNSRYRNPENQNKLGGKLLELGRATGIVAVTLFGFDVSLEAAHSADSMLIFTSAMR